MLRRSLRSWAHSGRTLGVAGHRNANRLTRRSIFFRKEPPRPLLDVHGLECPADFPRLAVEVVAEVQQEVVDVTNHGPDALVGLLDNASDKLRGVADAAELCRNMHPDHDFAASANEAFDVITAHTSKMNQDADIYRAIQEAEASMVFGSCSSEKQVVLRRMRGSMENAGVHLANGQKAELYNLQQSEQRLVFEIMQRQEQLSQGAAASGSVWLPVSSVSDALASHVEHLPKRRGNDLEEVLVPSDCLWTEQILTTVVCPTTRRKIFQAQQTPDDRGEEMVAGLCNIRQRLAKLRGFQTWSEYVQRECLLDRPEHVLNFFEVAWQRIRPGLEAELHVLAREKERLGLGEPILDPWDCPLLLHRIKQRDGLEDSLSNYLTFASLMRGVDMILGKLLGLTFVQETPGRGEVWHSSVKKYTIRDSGQVQGVLYLDPFARSGKAVSDAQFTIRGSKTLADGTRQAPVAVLAYSLPAENVALPLPYAVTFMHEMGHALHALLSHTELQYLSGTRGSLDFVEFPSHLFEHYVRDADCLAMYARHRWTRMGMPAALRERYRSKSSRFLHFDAAQQLLYAVMDQACYGIELPKESNDVCARALAKRIRKHIDRSFGRFDKDVSAPINGRVSSLLGLSGPSKMDHLILYGGMYYCYLFNRVLSAHVWEQTFRDDPFGREAGQRLRALFKQGSVDCSFETIDALCAGSAGINAREVPLDAFIAQLGHCA